MQHILYHICPYLLISTCTIYILQVLINVIEVTSADWRSNFFELQKLKVKINLNVELLDKNIWFGIVYFFNHEFNLFKYFLSI